MLILVFDNGGKLYAYRSFNKVKKAEHTSSAYVLVFDKGIMIDNGTIDVFINV